MLALWFIGILIPAFATNVNTLIKDVRILDARGDQGIHSVLITNDRIVAIDPDTVPESAHIFDGTGQTLMPGLIDSHVHISMIPAESFHNESATSRRARHAAHLRSYLAWGVTTIVDPGITPSDAIEIQSILQDTPGPEVLFIGPILGPTRGYPSVVVDKIPGISTPEEAIERIDEFEALNPVGIKVTFEDGLLGGVWPVFPWKIQKTIIEEAKKRHRKIYVHATDAEMIRMAMQLNPHALVHSPQSGTPKLAKSISEQGAYVCTTAALLGGPKLKWYPEWLETPKVEWSVPPDEIAAAQDPIIAKRVEEELWRTIAPGWPNWLGKWFLTKWTLDYLLNRNLKMINRLKQEKVPLVLGSDAPGWPMNPYTLHGVSTLLEVDLLHQAGLTPLEIIRAATLTPAEMLGLTAELGTIEAGKRADLLILNQDPLKNINALRHPMWVMRAGEMRRPKDWMND